MENLKHSHSQPASNYRRFFVHVIVAAGIVSISSMVKTTGHISAIILVLVFAVFQRNPRTIMLPLPLDPLITLQRRHIPTLQTANIATSVRMIALQTSQFHLEPPNEGQPRRHSLLVLVVIFTEEVQQRDFLHEDPIVEELPAGNGVDDEAHRISQDHLRPDGPPEPAHVGWMPHQTVHAVGDQLVSLVALELDLGRMMKFFLLHTTITVYQNLN